MALAKRLIPCLDVDAGRVVKGIRFTGIRDAGDPVQAAGAAWRWRKGLFTVFEKALSEMTGVIWR